MSFVFHQSLRLLVIRFDRHILGRIKCKFRGSWLNWIELVCHHLPSLPQYLGQNHWRFGRYLLLANRAESEGLFWQLVLQERYQITLCNNPVTMSLHITLPHLPCWLTDQRSSQVYNDSVLPKSSSFPLRGSFSSRQETILTKGLPRKAPNGTGQLLPVDYTDPKVHMQPECFVTAFWRN